MQNILINLIKVEEKDQLTQNKVRNKKSIKDNAKSQSSN